MVHRTRTQSVRMGAPRAEALCLNFGGALDFVFGHWDAAETSLSRATALYGELGSASGESLSQQRLGVLLTAKGRLDEGWTILNEGIAVAERATMRSHCLTRLYASMARNRLAAGDLPAATQCLEEGEEVAARHGACVTCSALLLPEAVRVAVANGELDEADRCAQELEQLAADYGSRAWRGMATHARGRVQLARDDAEGALTSLTAAVETYAKHDPYEWGRALVDQADALAALGDETGAAEARGSAASLFATIGAAAVER